MPQPESESIITPQRVVGLVLRGKWWILLVTCLAVAASIALLRILPKRYVSSATLQVEQQTVSQRYVASDIPTSIPDVIQTMVRQVMSRARLASIIEEFNLYPERKDVQLDLLAERLRDEISIDPVDIGPGGVYSAFQVSFSSGDPQLSQAVTTRLASLFIEENTRTRTVKAESTANFVNDQLKEARAKLAAQDQQIRDFKSQHLNELPDRQGATAGAVTDLRLQLQGVTADLKRAEDQLSTLTVTLTDRIARLKQERTDLLGRFTAQHASVVKKTAEIDRWDGLMRSVQRGISSGDNAGAAGISDDPTFAQLKSQIETKPAEIARLQAEERRLKGELAQVNSGLSQAPIREQQLTGLTRTYDQLSDAVRDLERQRLQSEMTENVEVSQQGQRFRLLDPPTLPVAPSSPDRLKVGGGGLAGGLLLGLAVAFLLDLRDTSFHSERDLKQVLKLPIVIGVPALLTAGELRTQKLKNTFEWLAMLAAVCALAMVELYVYQNG